MVFQDAHYAFQGSSSINAAVFLRVGPRGKAEAVSYEHENSSVSISLSTKDIDASLNAVTSSPDSFCALAIYVLHNAAIDDLVFGRC